MIRHTKRLPPWRIAVAGNHLPGGAPQCRLRSSGGCPSTPATSSRCRLNHDH